MQKVNNNFYRKNLDYNIEDTSSFSHFKIPILIPAVGKTPE